MFVIELDPSMMVPAVTVKNVLASTMEYSSGPQREATAVAVEIESVAWAKVWETEARVTVFVIADRELKPKEMIVEGQGLSTVT